MKKVHSLLRASALLVLLMLTACQGHVTVTGENGKSDTIEFDTDTIRHLDISVQMNGADVKATVTTSSDTLQ